MKNEYLQNLVKELKKVSATQKSKVWRAVAEELQRPSRQMRVVNISKINRYANEGDTVVVPGKVLGSGELTKKVTVIAYQFSKQAQDKISQSGKLLSIEEALKNGIKNKGIKIIG
ncbi:50S ribosomal protein L18e [Candidatus Woesearchaeota archaeon]|nr:MAG: 50S ribosomal protein L18e [Candidatus Woesearchaeota archaeon]